MLLDPSKNKLRYPTMYLDKCLFHVTLRIELVTIQKKELR